MSGDNPSVLAKGQRAGTCATLRAAQGRILFLVAQLKVISVDFYFTFLETATMAFVDWVPESFSQEQLPFTEQIALCT